MQAADKARLLACRLSLCEQLSLEAVATHLLQEGVLSPNDMQRLTARPTEREQVLGLLDVLPRKGPNAFAAFRDALATNYPWLLAEMDQVDMAKALARYPFLLPNHHQDTDCPALEQEVGPEAVQVLRRNVSLLTRWPVLARQLGLSQSVPVIRVRCNVLCQDQSECIYEMMEAWKGLLGRRATLGRLVAALRAEEFNDIADELMSKLALHSGKNCET